MFSQVGFVDRLVTRMLVVDDVVSGPVQPDFSHPMDSGMELTLTF